MTKLRKFPFFAYRLLSGFFGTKSINFLPFGAEPPNRGITVFYQEPVNLDDPVTPEVREAIRQIGIIEQKRTGLLVCSIYGLHDCDYYTPDGLVHASDSPPRLGIDITQIVPTTVREDKNGRPVSLDRLNLNGEQKDAVVH